MMSRESCGKLPGKHENCPWSQPSFWKLTETFIFAKHLVEVARGFTNQNRVANMECEKKNVARRGCELDFFPKDSCALQPTSMISGRETIWRCHKVGQIEFAMRIWDVLNKPKQNYMYIPQGPKSWIFLWEKKTSSSANPSHITIQIPQVKILNLPDHTQRFPQDLHLHLRHLSSNAASDVKLVLSFASKGASRRPPSHLNHLLVKKKKVPGAPSEVGEQKKNQPSGYGEIMHPP